MIFDLLTDPQSPRGWDQNFFMLRAPFDKINKFSFLKVGLSSLKTACAPCMLGTSPNSVIFTLHQNHVIDEHQQ